VVTSAAGNEAFFDASGDNPYILTVGATDANDVITAWTNTGNNIDLTAPGTVFSTFSGGTYNSASGTSVSSPVVAGAAALVLSANPSLTGSQVQNILKQSADDLGVAGWDTNYGAGRVNVGRAVSLASGTAAPLPDVTRPTVGIISPANGTSITGSVTVSVSATDNTAVSSVTLSIDGVATATDTASPYTFAWDTNAVLNGSHTLSATAVDAAGNTNSASISVIVNNVLDTTPPVITITSPGDGTKVTTNVTVKVNASDNVGLVRVELYVDGMLQGVSTTAPFTTKWNAAKATKGPHTLSCKAYDSAGNVGLSQSVSVSK